MSTIRPGDPAPDFVAVDQDGRERSPAEFLGEKAIVLFFYPKDESPVCTKEACRFRDFHEDFHEAGAVVLGVSGDSAERHRAFADRRRLPYPLLVDSDGTLRRAFGVSRTLGLLPGRATYVIDRRGIVRLAVCVPFSAERHVDEALAAVRKLADDERAGDEDNV